MQLTSVPSCSASTEAFDHSVVVAAAAAVFAVTGYLLQQQAAVHGSGPDDRPALDLVRRVYCSYFRKVAAAWPRQVAGAGD